jgi:lambda family phage minor tail protein L
MTVLINTEIQEAETSNVIELFDLDLTMFGDNIYHFIAGALEGGTVIWKGNVYTPFDVEAEGFEYDGRGSPPMPKIRFSLTNPIITGYINAFKDLIGAKITRTKTYKKFLDTESTANANAHYPLDIYRIERKASENRLMVEFELSSVMDQRGTQLPGRTITAFYCPWIYRRYNGVITGDPLVDFSYHAADNACPYQGSAYFDSDNVSTTNPALDKCPKTETGCKKRFGDNGILPFGGFPGASRAVVA